jgi:hypothetical protein
VRGLQSVQRFPPVFRMCRFWECLFYASLLLIDLIAMSGGCCEQGVGCSGVVVLVRRAGRPSPHLSRRAHRTTQSLLPAWFTVVGVFGRTEQA